MAYKIRRGTSSDINDIVELRLHQLKDKMDKSSLEQLSISTIMYLKLQLVSNNVLTWIVEQDSDIVGVAFVEVRHGIPRASNISGVYGEIFGAYVLPDYRGQDLGIRLLTEIVMDMKSDDRELGYIKVDVEPQLEKFFKKVGFTPHGRELRLRYNRKS